MSSTGTQPSSTLFRPDVWCAALFVLAWEGLIFSWPALPAQDAPMWIYEGALLHDLVSGRYAGPCHLVSALPPNALAQSVIALLCFAMPPALAGRVYIGACVASFAAGLVYLCRARDASGRSLALPLCLPLCAGYPLFHGFLNYMAALPALCFGLGALLRNPEARALRGACLLLAMPVLTYLCHGTALGIWCVIVALQFWVTRSRAFGQRALLSLAPVLVLIALYVAQRSAEGASIRWGAGGVWATVLYRARSPFRFITLFHGLVPTFGDPLLRALAPLLVIVNLAYTAAMSGSGLRWAWRARSSSDAGERLLASALLALALLFVLMPHDVAKMLNPAERLLLPAACIGAAGLASRLGVQDGRAGWRARLQTGACYVLLSAQLSYFAVWGTRAARDAEAFIAERERYIDADELRVVRDDAVALPPSAARPSMASAAIGLLTRHQALTMQGTLEDWARGRAPRPFETGLFRCPPLPPRRDDLAALRARGQVVMIIGEPERSHALAKALAPELRVIRSGAGFTTLVRSQP